MYTLKGELKVIKDVQQISDSFKKREFVVEDTSGKYPQVILFQLVQDRVDNLNEMAAGDQVEVTFFLRGREWTNPKDGEIRYFNTLDAWKVEKTSEEVSQPSSSQGGDDLPF